MRMDEGRTLTIDPGRGRESRTSKTPVAKGQTLPEDTREVRGTTTARSRQETTTARRAKSTTVAIVIATIGFRREALYISLFSFLQKSRYSLSPASVLLDWGQSIFWALNSWFRDFTVLRIVCI